MSAGLHLRPLSQQSDGQQSRGSDGVSRTISAARSCLTNAIRVSTQQTISFTTALLIVQLSNRCNWVGADSNYCGKRFAASEELFQHLRSEHTGNAIPDSLLNASSASTNSLLAAFPRAYPTPPLSPLSSARYHPYANKNPLLPPTPSLAGLLPPHPSLAQYFSPYGLYPRMNSSNLHP